MKKGLIYTLPVLLATACSDPATEIPSSSINCVHAPLEADLQPYYDLLTNNPPIIDAMKLCERPASFQKTLWNKLQEAEKTGLPPTASLPLSFYTLEADQKNLSVTKEEAHEIYAAHLAHSLWLEKNEIVPWSYSDYNQEQLGELLQPEAWFSSWDEAEDNYAFSYILDYSPRETFSVANESVSSFSDQKAALIDIIKTTRPFRHGIAVTYDGEGNNTGEHDPMEIVTPEIMKGEKISRHGCQTMSPYIVALANSLNIPGDTILGYYAAAGHRSALFSFTDQVLSHGDDVYTGYLKNTPSSELMDRHEFWEEHVFAYPKGDELGTHNSLVHTKENERKYPAKSLLRDYCEEGKVSLDERFKDFASEEEIKALEQKIVEITEGCTFFPEDNPDQ